MYRTAILGLLVAVGTARAQPDPSTPEGVAGPPTTPVVPGRPPTNAGGLPWGLQSTLEALGASTGVPDGAGYSWYPGVPVLGQRASMGLSNYQFGLTVPVATTDHDGLFADIAARVLDIRSNALLPRDRTRFPASLWDVQFGGGYVRQFGDGSSWGATLNLGSASDRPFRSLGELTMSSLIFLRTPHDDRNGWLFYVVSTTSGQLGRNIPVPGVAYEYDTDRLHAVLGFPFLTLDYRPVRAVQFELYYAAITDLQTRVSYRPTDAARVFAGFEWANHSWYRAGRQFPREQFFQYEKRVEGGFGYAVHRRVDLRLSGGYAFDRFFVENSGLSFRGRNRVDLAPGPFVAFQCELKF